MPAAAREQNRAKYADPDTVHKPVDSLRTFYPAYTKTEGARRMGRRLDPSRNSSRSFQVFCEGIQRITAEVS